MTRAPALDDDERAHEARGGLCPKRRRADAAAARWSRRRRSRITAPSPISAVLSATATSLAGASLPRCAVSAGSLSASAAASERHLQDRAPARRCRTIPARTRRRRRRCRRASTSPSICPAVLARALAAASGGLAERLRLAHQRAQVGILPVLDAAMRQAFPGENVEGGGALRRDRRRRPAAARAPAQRRAPARSPPLS